MSIIPLKNGCLSIITTDGCTARCSHCLMNCTPQKRHKLQFEQMQESIDQIIKKYDLNLVVFTGGEPTLLGEELCRIIRYCTLRFLRTRVVTNAHWATSLERAQRYIEKFRSVGLCEINFSIDDYHEPYIPLENIRNAWRACKGAGFDAVVLANSHGQDDKITPKYIQKYLGEKIEITTPYTPEALHTANKTSYIIYENTLQKTGRAKALDNQKFNQPQSSSDLKKSCKSAVDDPVLSCIGHVWACCGITSDNNPLLDLGDTSKENIKTIMNRASKDVILNAIHDLGPLRLCQFVEEHSDIKFKKNYNEICEICSALTNNKKAVQVLRDNEKAIAAMLRTKKKLEKISTLFNKYSSNF